MSLPKTSTDYLSDIADEAEHTCQHSCPANDQ